MADPAIRADILQALDIHHDRLPKISFDGMIFFYDLAETVHFVLRQSRRFRVGIHLRHF